VNNPKRITFLKSLDSSVISKSTDHKICKMLDNMVEEFGKENIIQIIKPLISC